jgi:radical SAM superfamily enzyme YgiQ (UPF0313 family)
VRVVLVATYELGHQPLHLAAPAASLRARGHEVRTLDASHEPWDPAAVDWADKVAFSVPRHTATRLTRELAAEIDRPVCCYGLYAAMCADVAEHVLAGEYLPGLLEWVEGNRDGTVVRLGRTAAQSDTPLPARDLLPSLEHYVHLAIGGERRAVGYVEASHGCSHRCRHCPVPVVYDGRIRIVNHDAVLRDVEQLAARGARHITFGDPDFLNGVQHSMRVVREVHERFPELSFDCTTKVEHILEHEDIWTSMATAGCLFVVSAFESVDDHILALLDKGHTAADAARATAVLREHGIEVRPSLLPFTPWTTRAGFIELLDFVHDHDLVGSVDPVQYTIRLLLPEGSLLLNHPDLAPHLGPYDPERLTHTWTAGDPDADTLQTEISDLVERCIAAGEPITDIYRQIRRAVGAPPVNLQHCTTNRPRLTESWFCCAEPTPAQRPAVARGSPP